MDIERKVERSRRRSTGGHTYSLDERDAEASAVGAPIAGFDYEQDLDDLTNIAHGPTILGDTEVLPDEAALDGPRNAPGEVAKGDPDIRSFGPNDARFGGEDVSVISEWTFRAHQPDLDAGLGAEQFKRTDLEIYEQLLETLEEECHSGREISIDVSGGEVTLSGVVTSREVRDQLETAALHVPGVRSVVNYVSILENA